MAQLEARGAGREYRSGSDVVTALDNVSMTVTSGEFVAIVGASGSGKSTLLHLLGGMDTPTSGQILLDDVRLGDMDDDALARLRRRRFGFVFQFFNLLPMLSAWENVALPALLDGSPLGRKRRAAMDALDRVGLANRSAHRPGELSGGEAQRVAIARAIMMNPAAVLADEPTGNLDSETGQRIIELLADISHDEDRLVVMVTHDRNAATWCDRYVTLADGRVAAN
jgi:putative ABC transport system ATP-binding protein